MSFRKLMNRELEPIQQQIVEAIKRKGEMSRADICKDFGFETHIYDFVVIAPSKKRYPTKVEQYKRRTTIYDNLVKLEKKGIVEKFSRNNGKVGAPIKMWKLTKKKGEENEE